MSLVSRTAQGERGYEKDVVDAVADDSIAGLSYGSGAMLAPEWMAEHLARTLQDQR